MLCIVLLRHTTQLMMMEVGWSPCVSKGMVAEWRLVWGAYSPEEGATPARVPSRHGARRRARVTEVALAEGRGAAKHVREVPRKTVGVLNPAHWRILGEPVGMAHPPGHGAWVASPGR